MQQKNTFRDSEQKFPLQKGTFYRYAHVCSLPDQHQGSGFLLPRVIRMIDSLTSVLFVFIDTESFGVCIHFT